MIYSYNYIRIKNPFGCKKTAPYDKIFLYFGADKPAYREVHL